MATVKAMTITVNSSVPRLKLDCDVGYDVAAKGASVAVKENDVLTQALGNKEHPSRTR